MTYLTNNSSSWLCTWRPPVYAVAWTGPTHIEVDYALDMGSDMSSFKLKLHILTLSPTLKSQLPVYS